MIFWSLCFLCKIDFFLFNEDIVILIKFGFFCILFLRWVVVSMFVFLLRLLIKLWVICSMFLLLLNFKFVVMSVRFGLFKGLLMWLYECNVWLDVYECLIFFMWYNRELIDCDKVFMFFVCMVSLRLMLFFIVLNFLLILVIKLLWNLLSLFFIIDCKEVWFFCSFCIVWVIIVMGLSDFVDLFLLFWLVILVVLVCGFGVLLFEDSLCLLLVFMLLEMV